MAYEVIRLVQGDPARNFIVTEHAMERMNLREITIPQALAALEAGESVSVGVGGNGGEVRRHLLGEIGVVVEHCPFGRKLITAFKPEHPEDWLSPDFFDDGDSWDWKEKGD